MSVIYKITNRVNGMYYVGSAVNVEKRWAEHVRELNSGDHGNRHLLSAWRKYGPNSFAFSIIEEIPDGTSYGEVLAIEQRHLDKLLTVTGQKIDRTKFYNISTSASGVRMCGEEHPMFGKTHCAETKEKLSELTRGAKNPRYGKKASVETRSKISEALRGRECPKITGENNPQARPIIQCDKMTGDFIARYGTSIEAMRITGISNSNISHCLRGVNKSAGGYLWRYAELA